MGERYFITLPGRQEFEVTRQEWCRHERGAGFHGPDHENSPATAGFSGINGVSGRIEYEAAIRKEDLITGGIYVMRSRSLRIAAYDGYGFIGIREKLGSRYLDVELPREGSLYGTATPLRQVASLLPGTGVLVPSVSVECTACGQRAWWTGPPGPAPWRCDGGCEVTHPVGTRVSNALFTLLEFVARG